MTIWKWIFNIQNSIYLVLIFFSLLYIILSTVSNKYYSVPFIANMIFSISSLLFLLKQSCFIKTPYFRFVNLFIALYIIGIIFNLMHLDYDVVFNLIVFIGLIVLFLIYKLKQPNKNWIDFLKIVLSCSFSFSLLSVSLHWPGQLESSILYNILVIFFIIHYVWINRKNSQWFWN